MCSQVSDESGGGARQGRYEPSALRMLHLWPTRAVVRHSALFLPPEAGSRGDRGSRAAPVSRFGGHKSGGNRRIMDHNRPGFGCAMAQENRPAYRSEHLLAGCRRAFSDSRPPGVCPDMDPLRLLRRSGRCGNAAGETDHPARGAALCPAPRESSSLQLSYREALPP
jgi:hypothetical protein